jgi:hypothetical protein
VTAQSVLIDYALAHGWDDYLAALEQALTQPAAETLEEVLALFGERRCPRWNTANSWRCCCSGIRPNALANVLRRQIETATQSGRSIEALAVTKRLRWATLHALRLAPLQPIIHAG